MTPHELIPLDHAVEPLDEGGTWLLDLVAAVDHRSGELPDDLHAAGPYRDLLGRDAVVCGDVRWTYARLDAEVARLRRENAQLRRANEILRIASAFSAAAELDRKLGQ